MTKSATDLILNEIKHLSPLQAQEDSKKAITPASYQNFWTGSSVSSLWRRETPEKVEALSAAQQEKIDKHLQKSAEICEQIEKILEKFARDEKISDLDTFLQEVMMEQIEGRKAQASLAKDTISESTQKLLSLRRLKKNELERLLEQSWVKNWTKGHDVLKLVSYLGVYMSPTPLNVVLAACLIGQKFEEWQRGPGQQPKWRESLKTGLDIMPIVLLTGSLGILLTTGGAGAFFADIGDKIKSSFSALTQFGQGLTGFGKYQAEKNYNITQGETLRTQHRIEQQTDKLKSNQGEISALVPQIQRFFRWLRENERKKGNAISQIFAK